MLEKRNKLKKFVVLGIVAMFASMSVIVLQTGNATFDYGQQSPNLMVSSQSTYGEINSTSLAYIAMKAYLEDSKWDNDHNVSVKFNYSSELSQVMSQWQEIYPKVLLQGGNPIYCLGWNSNYTGIISLNLIAKYIKNQQITSKKSFTIENINGTSTVVVKTIKKSSVGNGQKNSNWDGYSFYSQGSKPCGWGPWPFSWTKHFNYAVSFVTEDIVIPMGVNDINEPGPISSSTSALRDGVDTYVPVAMSIWDSLSYSSSGSNMVQAGVELAPKNAPCIWYEHYYTGVCYGACKMQIQGSQPQPGDTICISINCYQGTFKVTYQDLSRSGYGCVPTTPSISKFTPYYFGSVVEAPEIKGKISQIPYFNPFSVHQLYATANGNVITGNTAWSNGWYDYVYLQQSSGGGQNLNNGFISGSTGAYTISLRTINYCIGYGKTKNYNGLPCPPC